MQTYEEQKAFVAKMNVIDDIFFQKMAEDKEVAEEILRIILCKPSLKVIDSHVQRFLRNTGAHSVILDLLCEDEDHSFINVEVQKSDSDDYQKRVRFNRSNIDTVFAEKGISYRELPDVYIVFISRFDIFNENRTIYHINRVIEETGTVVDNGVHEIYVNTAVDDKSDIAELMQYFKKSVGEHQKFKKLCNRVKYFRETQKGVSNMCKLVEDYAKQYAAEHVSEYAADYAKEYAKQYAAEHVSEYAADYAKEYAKQYAAEYAKQYAAEYAKQYAAEQDVKTASNFLQNGVPVDIIAKSIPTLSYDFILELSKKI